MLEKFLDEKPLYYDEIDYTRMPRVYARIKEHFNVGKVVHLIGTNGKGTTGRFLATALYNLKFTVGHYTSPHIENFNERVWLNGADISDEKLNSVHKKLQNILSKEESDSLSYFEYTTLIAMAAFEGMEYVVLEAGLGGEHDATAVFDKELTLVTPIDLDHEAFLGSTIKEIAKTKLNAVQNCAIVAQQKHNDVYDIATKIMKEREVKFFFLENVLDEKDSKNSENISLNLNLSSYLKSNLSLAISALKYLNIKYNLESFNNSRLFGRLTQYRENIILDVGHNVLASSSILKALEPKKYILIYNSYRDKEYKEILTILKPIIKRVEIIKVEDSRIESLEVLQESIDELKIVHSEFVEVDSKESYLVFGSFKVVEEFLRSYNG
jgi:dihydrofolate synthase/folylpolyglutamate synthase